MLTHLLAILGLALLAAGWLAVQRLVQRLDPDNPGLERGCSGCGLSAENNCGGKGCGRPPEL